MICFILKDLCDVGAFILSWVVFLTKMLLFYLCDSPFSFFFYLPKLHQLLVQFQPGDKDQDFSLAPIQVSISVQLWRLPGCHEFLAALGESSVMRVPTCNVM